MKNSKWKIKSFHSFAANVKNYGHIVISYMIISSAYPVAKAYVVIAK